MKLLSMRKLTHLISCCTDNEKADFLSSHRVALPRETEMNFLFLEVKAERIVDESDCLSLLCGILVYNVLKS